MSEVFKLYCRWSVNSVNKQQMRDPLCTVVKCVTLCGYASIAELKFQLAALNKPLTVINNINCLEITVQK